MVLIAGAVARCPVHFQSRVPLLIEPSWTFCTALSSFYCQASHSTVGVHFTGVGVIEGAQTYESVEVWVAMRRAAKANNGG